VVDLGGGDELFLGEIVQVYCNEDALKDGEPDLATVKPILFTFGDNKYWRTGPELAPAWSIGKELQRK
jgi:flavin reductase (DIM6/NTAB) family NADH-FMN oxidoreductase RutF